VIATKDVAVGVASVKASIPGAAPASAVVDHAVSGYGASAAAASPPADAYEAQHNLLRRALYSKYMDDSFKQRLLQHVEPTNRSLYLPLLNMDGSAESNGRFLEAATRGNKFLHFPGIAQGMQSLLPSLLIKGGYGRQNIKRMLLCELVLR
jgi:hypothetical protein